MNRGRLFLKLAALTSSVLLMGVFIAYRAGAFDRAIAPITNPTPTDPETDFRIYSSKSAPIVVDPPKGENPTLDPMFLGTSKSIVLPKQPTPPVAPRTNESGSVKPSDSTPEKKSPMLMGGPKSAEIIKPPVLMGGTKSDEMIKPPPKGPNPPRTPEIPNQK